MNQLWWIPASVGGLCLMAMLFEIIDLARWMIADRADDYPEQHEHVPGEWL